MDQTEWNPWRRLLALPNESRTKTILVAFMVSAFCAALVSTATVVLRPIKAANRAAEEQARIADLISGVPGMAALLNQPGGKLSRVVINLDRGRAATKVTPMSLETVLADESNWTTLMAGVDLAGLGRRPNYAQVFLLRQGDRVVLLLLPIAGQGYGGQINAILALGEDMNTIAGLVVTDHSETPGLGARIGESVWQESFRGTEIRDVNGAIRFTVARGPASGVHEVDGITGATRTGSGVTRMVRFWLGPQGYGSLIRAIGKGEF